MSHWLKNKQLAGGGGCTFVLGIHVFVFLLIQSRHLVGANVLILATTLQFLTLMVWRMLACVDTTVYLSEIIHRQWRQFFGAWHGEWWLEDTCPLLSFIWCSSWNKMIGGVEKTPACLLEQTKRTKNKTKQKQRTNKYRTPNDLHFLVRNHVFFNTVRT